MALSDLVQYLQPISFLLCQQQLLLFFGHLSEWLTQQELSTLPIQEFLTLLRHNATGAPARRALRDILGMKDRSCCGKRAGAWRAASHSLGLYGLRCPFVNIPASSTTTFRCRQIIRKRRNGYLPV